MKLYTGIDLHSSNSYLGIVDVDGKRASRNIALECRIPGRKAQYFVSTDNSLFRLEDMSQIHQLAFNGVDKLSMQNAGYNLHRGAGASARCVKANRADPLMTP